MPVFETPGSVSLHVRLPSGRVVVTAADEPRTTVELVARGRRGTDALEDIEVRADERPGGHDVTIEQQDRFRWGPIQISWGRDVEVRITCPPGSDLELSGGSTDLRAEIELGEVTVKTASGDVKLGTARRKLEVKTASGDVSVDAIESAGSLATVSGDLRVGELADKVNARTVSGDAEIRTVRGPLTLSTTSGDVKLGSVEAGEVRIQSVSGDVNIGVGRGTRVWIDAVSVSGDLGSELGLEDTSSAAAQEDEAAVVPLQVKTVSGDVAIVRAAEIVSS
jgi:Putative adhesin